MSYKQLYCMNRLYNRTRCCFRAAILSASLLLPACAHTELPEAQQKALRYPVTCEGITVGSSKDADVQRLYGTGYFVTDEGHGGGRYYVDRKQYLTLHVEIGPDSVIESVEYQQGLHLPGKASARRLRRATTTLPSWHKRTPGSLALGASAHSLLARYGRPQEDERDGQKRVIGYETNETVTQGVIDYEAEFRFLKDCLVYVKLYNGD